MMIAVYHIERIIDKNKINFSNRPYTDIFQKAYWTIEYPLNLLPISKRCICVVILQSSVKPKHFLFVSDVFNPWLEVKVGVSGFVDAVMDWTVQLQVVTWLILVHDADMCFDVQIMMCSQHISKRLSYHNIVIILSQILSVSLISLIFIPSKHCLRLNKKHIDSSFIDFFKS